MSIFVNFEIFSKQIRITIPLRNLEKLQLVLYLPFDECLPFMKFRLFYHKITFKIPKTTACNNIFVLMYKFTINSDFKWAFSARRRY